MDKPTIAVLLSAYNGEKFIKEQIDSILKQKDVELNLFVRLDGCTDSTKEIVNSYNGIHVFEEENIGLAKSFMELIKKAGCDYDYYCFADQDDIWLEEKLIKAIDKLKDKTQPTLYTSNQKLVDVNADFIGMRYSSPVNVSYKQILCNNLVAGCTMVWNKALQQYLLDNIPTDDLLKKRIHDVWVGMVAASIGEVIYDEESYILYRQHANNVVGVKKRNKLLAQFKKFRDKSKQNGRSFLAYEILNKFSDNVSDDKKEFLNKCAFYKSNRKLKKALLKDEEVYKLTGESKKEFKLKVRLGLF